MVAHLRALGFEVEDLGTPSAESTDYPDWAAAVGRAVRDHAGSLGVLVCGTGLGVCMAANKIHGVRAADAGASRRRVCRVRTTTPTCYAWERAWCRRRRRSPSSTPGWTPNSKAGGTRAGSTRSRRSRGRRGAQRARAATDEARGSPQMTASKQTTLHQTHALGQSIWYDNMRRSLLTLRRAGEADRAGRARHDVEPDHLREGDRRRRVTTRTRCASWSPTGDRRSRSTSSWRSRTSAARAT